METLREPTSGALPAFVRGLLAQREWGWAEVVLCESEVVSAREEESKDSPVPDRFLWTADLVDPAGGRHTCRGDYWSGSVTIYDLNGRRISPDYMGDVAGRVVDLLHPDLFRPLAWRPTVRRGRELCRMDTGVEHV